MARFIRSSTRRFLILVPCGALLAAGCREKAISYYEVPREEPKPVVAAANSPAGIPGGSGVPSPGRPAGAQLEWDKPAAWTERPAGQMRLGSYAFTASDGGVADVSVTAFPDSAGGLLANLNRWRGQVGLEPVTEAGLSSSAERTTIVGQAAWLVDFAGIASGSAPAMGNVPAPTGPTRIIGAIIPISGTSWFFKMMGPDAVVASQRGAFGQMIASIRAVTPSPTTPPVTTAGPGPVAPDAAMPNDDVHAGLGPSTQRDPMTPAGMSGGAAAVPPPPAAIGFSFTAPAGWQEQPSTPFRVVNFIVPGTGVPAAEFYATPLTGAAGGELANVNRWRAQLQLPPVAETELPGLATIVNGPAGTFKVFDLASTTPVLKSGEPARMLVAILARGDTSWFFRLTGEINHVAAQRDTFTAFLQSCRFESAP